MDTPSNPDHLTEQQVSEKYNIEVRTLQQWRHGKRVLPYLKFGKLVRYRRTDLEAYASKHLVKVEA